MFQRLTFDLYFAGGHTLNELKTRPHGKFNNSCDSPKTSKFPTKEIPNSLYYKIY